MKVGRGQADACVGTWDLGTRDRDEGLEDKLLQKSEVNAISVT